jgi:plastocyanin
MPFSWIININRNPGIAPRVKFDPNPLQNVGTGDQIVWANNDSAAHWPGLVNDDGTIDKTFFMPNQIAPNSTSQAFSPGVAATLNYVCSIHPDEKGSITVIAINT